MNRIIAFLLVGALLGVLLFTTACGPSGYETGSEDPKAGPAQESEGIDPDQKVPVDVPGSSGDEAKPPPAPEGD